VNIALPLAALLAAGLLVWLLARERGGRRARGVAWAAGPVTVIAVGLLGTMWASWEAFQVAAAGYPETRSALLSSGLAEALRADQLGSILGGGLLVLAAVAATAGAWLAPEDRRPDAGPRRLLVGLLLAAGLVALGRGIAEARLVRTFAAVASTPPEFKQAELAAGISDSIVPRVLGLALGGLALLAGGVAAALRWRELVTRKALLGGLLVVLLFGGQSLTRGAMAFVLMGDIDRPGTLEEPWDDRYIELTIQVPDDDDDSATRAPGPAPGPSAR